MTTQPVSNALKAIAFVSGYPRGSGTRATQRLRNPNGIQRFFEELRVVDLPRSDVNAQGKASAVRNQVQFTAESTARAAKSVVCGLVRSPFFPAPAAAREARTAEPSMHQRSQSILPSLSNRICRASKTRSKVPSFRQELNR